MSRTHLVCSICSIASLLAACGGGGPPSKYPAMPEGCEVQIYPGSPPMPTDNIGSVRAACDDRLSEAECVRELKDQACKIGANVVWGVPPSPTFEDRKQLLSGRAAHTK